MPITGKYLADERFRPSIEAVAPGFLDGEISSFLTQGQIALVKNLLATNAMSVLSPLIVEGAVEVTSNLTDNMFANDLVYEFALEKELLKLIDGSVIITKTLNEGTIYDRCDIYDVSSMFKLLTTNINNPYLEKPALVVNNAGLSDNYIVKNAIVILGKDGLYNNIQVQSIKLVYKGVKFPKPIDATDNSNEIEFPEFADEIVGIATELALKSLYMVQGVVNGDTQQNSNTQ